MARIATTALVLLPLFPLLGFGQDYEFTAAARELDGAVEYVVKFEEVGVMPTESAGVLILSMPSATPLLAHVKATEALVEPPPAALVTQLDDSLSFSTRFVVPEALTTQGDNRLLVVLRTSQQDRVIADAHLFSTTSFSFESSWSLGGPVSPSSCPGGQFRHCCRSGPSGGDCGELCTCCNGPSFFCNLLPGECERECLDE